PVATPTGEGGAGGGAGPAESGVSTGAADGPPPGQEAQTGRRRYRPELVADGSRPCQTPRASTDIRVAAGARRHGIGRIDRSAQRHPWLLRSIRRMALAQAEHIILIRVVEIGPPGSLGPVPGAPSIVLCFRAILPPISDHTRI